MMPSPDQYNILFSEEGKESISKYRTVTLGNAGFQYRNERFKDSSCMYSVIEIVLPVLLYISQIVTESINIQKVEELDDAPDFHLLIKLLTLPSLPDQATT